MWAEEEKVAKKTGEIKLDYLIINNNNAEKQCFFIWNKQNKILSKALKESCLEKEKTFTMNWNTTYIIRKTVKYEDLS